MPAWTWYVMGGALVAFALVIFLWALFHDRSRGRRRCPKCWYDMSGTQSLRCPECGRAAAREREFHRTRRRWRWAPIGLLPLLASHFILRMPAYQRENWTGFVPTTFLVYWADGSATTGWRKQLEEAAIGRVTTGRSWDWQSRIYVERWLRSNIDSMFYLPKRWIAGRDMPVIVPQAPTSPAGLVSLSGLPTVAKSDGYTTMTLRGSAVTLDSLHLPLSVTRGDVVILNRTIRIPRANAADVQTLLFPDARASITTTIRNALDIRIVQDVAGIDVVAGTGTGALGWHLVECGVGFTVEVTFDGAVVARGACLSSREHTPWKDSNVVPMDWTPDTLQRILAQPQRARFIITGDPTIAAPDYLADPFRKNPAAWAGRYEADVRIDPVRSPQRR